MPIENCSVGAPPISVVIPTYNRARFILEALESVLVQTYPVDEIIVVDDGSTDNTAELVASLRSRVTYIVQSNAGPGAARNRGVRSARGEWIAFLDSDDRWDPEHIAQIIENLSKCPNAAMAYCGKRWVYEDGQVMTDVPLQVSFPSGWIFRDLFEANYISSASVVMVKRQAFLDAGGFDERFRSIAEDYDLWMRISAVAQIVAVPAYTVLYRRHDSNLTHQAVKQVRADLEVLKNAMRMIARRVVKSENQPESINIRSRMKSFYCHAAVTLFTLGAYEDMRSIGFDALIHGHASPGVLARWGLCMLPSRLTTGLRNLRRRALC